MPVQRIRAPRVGERPEDLISPETQALVQEELDKTAAPKKASKKATTAKPPPRDKPIRRRGG